MAQLPRKIPVVFYRTRAGSEVVLDWLRSLDEEDRRVIGQDLMRVQFRWPIGMPLCRSLGDGLWEVRCSLSGNRIARLLFCFTQGRRFTASSRSPRRHRRVSWKLRASVRASLSKESVMAPRKKKRDAKKLTTLESFLEAEGTRDAFQAVAIKEVIAWQIGEAMKGEGLSRKRMAERMGTSRSQIARLLDPTDGNVTLATLQRAAAMLGRKVRVELV